MNKSYTDKIYHFIRDCKNNEEHLFWHIFAFWLGKKDCRYCNKCIFGNTVEINKCTDMYKMEIYLKCAEIYKMEAYLR